MRNVIAPALASLAMTVVSAPSSAYTLSGTYYEDSATANCNTSTITCTLQFGQLPSTLAGKLLTLTEISCTVNAAQVLVQGFMKITDAGAGARRQHSFGVPRVTGFSSLREPVNFKIAGGPPRQLQVYLHQQPSGVMFADCTVVGTISDQ